MAASSSSSSLSAETHERENYELYISFRGSDVRRGFLSHLYPALKAKKINAFIDSDLASGADITENLFRIIEQANVSIVIFSQNYPKSEWCLEELVKIHESMKQREQIVLPVFYEVDPSDVQDLRGNYAIQLQKWRDALVEISSLSGFDSRNSINDANLIEDIVVHVLKKLSENGLFETLGAAAPEDNVASTPIFGIGENEEWLILWASLAIEGLSALFEQLDHGLLGLQMAILGLLLCLAEIFYRAWAEQVSVEWIGDLPFFFSRYPSHKPFGTTVQYFGLVAAVWQCFHTCFGYFYGSEYPIKMSLTMFLFCTCLIVSKIVNKYSRRSHRSLETA